MKNLPHTVSAPQDLKPTTIAQISARKCGYKTNSSQKTTAKIPPLTSPPSRGREERGLQAPCPLTLLRVVPCSLHFLSVPHSLLFALSQGRHTGLPLQPAFRNSLLRAPCSLHLALSSLPYATHSDRSEEHTSELQPRFGISYAAF